MPSYSDTLTTKVLCFDEVEVEYTVDYSTEVSSIPHDTYDHHGTEVDIDSITIDKLTWSGVDGDAWEELPLRILKLQRAVDGYNVATATAEQIIKHEIKEAFYDDLWSVLSNS